MVTGSLPLEEIQGLLASGYADQVAMCVLLLRINDDVDRAKAWLARLSSQISFCNDKSAPSKLNVAFTYRGLQVLARPDDLRGFSREFCEGMVTPHRQRVLGDLPDGLSDPQRWRWGGPTNAPIDLVLLVYEKSSIDLARRLIDLRDDVEGVEVIEELPSHPLQDDKEHFGFRDGMAQPWIAHFHKAGHNRDRVAAGEFILGHPDNTLAPEPAPRLAANGSYLVVRQLAQRVAEFWKAMDGNSPEERIRQAALRVGRWPDGTPVTLSPAGPDPRQSLTDFSYAPQDRDGLCCPLGSHVRRSNPRDALLTDPTESLMSVNRHRLLRRGRSYGLPVPTSVYPPGLCIQSLESAVTLPTNSAQESTAPPAGLPPYGRDTCCSDGIPPTTPENRQEDEAARGLLFMCLNASLSRQFEFVQQNWMNNPKFQLASAETDPIASSVQWTAGGETPQFTIPRHPLRYRQAETAKFVFTIGGGYFFLPGRAALCYLSH